MGQEIIWSNSEQIKKNNYTNILMWKFVSEEVCSYVC